MREPRSGPAPACHRRASDVSGAVGQRFAEKGEKLEQRDAWIVVVWIRPLRAERSEALSQQPRDGAQLVVADGRRDAGNGLCVERDLLDVNAGREVFGHLRPPSAEGITPFAAIVGRATSQT